MWYQPDPNYYKEDDRLGIELADFSLISLLDEPADSLNRLPNALLAKLCSYLNAADLQNLMSANKRFHQLTFAEQHTLQTEQRRSAFVQELIECIRECAHMHIQNSSATIDSYLSQQARHIYSILSPIPAKQPFSAKEQLFCLIFAKAFLSLLLYDRLFLSENKKLNTLFQQVLNQLFAHFNMRSNSPKEQLKLLAILIRYTFLVECSSLGRHASAGTILSDAERKLAEDNLNYISGRIMEALQPGYNELFECLINLFIAPNFQLSDFLYGSTFSLYKQRIEKKAVILRLASLSSVCTKL